MEPGSIAAAGIGRSLIRPIHGVSTEIPGEVSKVGWTVTHRERGVSHRDWFAREFGVNPERFVDIGSVGTTVYAAYRSSLTEPEYPDGRIIGLVILTARYPSDPYYNFGYKEMDETMGPAEDRMPERILNKLDDPPDGEYAAQWRERVRAYHAERKARPKTKRGDVLLFESPIGGETRFTLVDPRRNILETTRGVRYRVSWWRTVKFSIA